MPPAVAPPLLDPPVAEPPLPAPPVPALGMSEPPVPTLEPPVACPPVVPTWPPTPEAGAPPVVVAPPVLIGSLFPSSPLLSAEQPAPAVMPRRLKIRARADRCTGFMDIAFGGQ